MTEVAEGFRPGQPEILRNTEGELPESKIFDLLSSVGNGEHHALDLIVMHDGVIYSSNAHYKEMISHQEKDRGWKISDTLSFKHCQNSLAPIGLVTKEALSLDGTAWGYQITQYGLRTGVPFAGLLLKWSHEHPEHSLYKMLGSTQSPSIKDEQTLDKKRAQETNYKIFWEIATNPSNRIRLIDIANAINEDLPLINGHMESLRRNGVISYESTERGKSKSFFKRKEIVPNKEPEPYKGHKTLSTRLYNFITQSFVQTPTKYLSVEEIANALIEEYPEYGGVRRYIIISRIPSCLSDFEKQGYIDREKFSYDFASEITLSDQQRDAIVSFVTLLDDFKNGGKQTIEEGRRFAQRVLNDPHLFSKLMLKAKEGSPFASRTTREDMEDWLISIVQKHPNSGTKQIQQFLEEEYDKKLGRVVISKYLSRLVEDERIISEKTKSGNEYRVQKPDIQAVHSAN